jgi:hypothetical protein
MTGVLNALGVFPFEGSLFPFGFHSLFPNFLRPYIPYYPKTNIPLPYYGMEWGNYSIFPFGMKTIPSKKFTSLNKQLYEAILDSDFYEIDKIICDGFDFEKEIIIPELSLNALGMAVSLNLFEVVHYLTKRGVDYEYQIGPYKKTALHIAIENGNELMAKYLLNNGANINARDCFGHDVYDKANFRGYYEYKRFLDYFKNNPKQRVKDDYDEYKYTREIILEEMDTLSFKPSQLLEFSIKNKLKNSRDTKHKIDLDKYEFYLFNLIEFEEVTKRKMDNLRKTYDSLKYYNYHHY